MKSLGAARMAAMAAVTLALIGFFAFLMVQMTTPQMVPLFTDLSVEDSASIIKDLERQAVPYQLKSDGAIIMVPKDKVARLRMKANLPEPFAASTECRRPVCTWSCQSVRCSRAIKSMPRPRSC